MKKATVNKLLVVGIVGGVVLLLRKASQVAPGPPGPALTGYIGTARHYN